jgi:hypothetical protein
MLISIGDIIKKTLDIYKKHFWVVLKYLVLALLPGIVGALATSFLLKNAASVVGYDEVILYIGIPIIAIIYIILIVLSLWFYFALVKVIDSLYNSQPALTEHEVLASTRHVIVRGAFTSILSGLYSGWPLLAFMLALLIRIYYSDYLPSSVAMASNILFFFWIIYGVLHLTFYSIRLFFSLFIAVLENKSPRESIAESQKRVIGHWWDIAVRVVVPMFVIYAVLLLVDIIFATIAHFTGDVGNAISSVIDITINYLAMPAALTVGVILYNETKKGI